MTMEQKLQKVIDLLDQADVEMQAALPDSVNEECYNLHNSIQLVIDSITDLNEALKTNSN